MAMIIPTTSSAGSSRPGATIGLLGDSITEQNYQTSATFGATLAKGFFTQANIFLDQRFEIIAYAGVAGNTTTQMVARFEADIIAKKPQYCFFMGGTNDVGSDVAPAVTIANYATMFARIRSAGIILLIGTVTPRNFSGMTQTRLRNLLALNAYLQDYATNNSGVILVDMYRYLLDYSTLITTSQGDPVAAFMDGAGLHPVAHGAFQLGYGVYRQLDALIPKLPRRLQINWNGTTGDNTNKISNGMFLGGTAGGLGLNATGVVAQSWSAAASGGTMAGNCSLVSRPAGATNEFPGTAQRVALSNAGATTEYFRLTPTMATPAAGDRVFMEVEFVVTVTSGTLNELSATFGTAGGTVIAGAANSMPSIAESLNIGSTSPQYRGTLKSPVMTAQTGIVGMYGSINMRTSVGAAVQIDFSNARLTTVI